MNKRFRKNCSLPDSEVIRYFIENRDDTYFTVLYYRYYRQVHRHCITYIKDSVWIEDCVQDVFVRVYQNLDKFKNQSPFPHWLSVLTRNACLNQLRNKKIIEIPLNENSILENFYEVTEEEKDPFEAFNAALKLISVQERELLYLKYEAGYTLNEMADYYKAPKSAIKMRLLRARRAINSKIEVD